MAKSFVAWLMFAVLTVGSLAIPGLHAAPLGAGAAHSVLLKGDGSVWSFGADGTRTDSRELKAVGGGFVKVAAGDGHALALKADGSLWSWGRNDSGQLGDGTTTFRLSPTLIGTGYVAIAATQNSSYGLSGDGTLRRWGAGQSLPQDMGSGYTKVFAGGYGSAGAIKSDGSLWMWGSNWEGQLGDGTTDYRSSPVRIGEGYREVAMGYYHTVGLKDDGSVWSWGYNGNGQLGDGTTQNTLTPKLVGNGYTAIAAGGHHTFALKGDGTLWSWGYNSYGVLGQGGGNVWGRELLPKEVGPNYAAIASYGISAVAVQTDGTLRRWGHDGVNTMWDTPTRVDEGNGFSQAVVGDMFGFVLKTDGSLLGWGRNSYGQLGIGSATYNLVPVQVDTGYLAVAAGNGTTYGIKEGGSLWAWGNNDYGRLGDGTWDNSPTPKQIGTEYAAIAAGYYHALGIKHDGSLWAWGGNGYGQLGDGTNNESRVPKQIGSGYKAVAVGAEFSLGLKTDGSLWGWGYNEYGQVGTADPANTVLAPAALTPGERYVAIAAGYHHGLALKEDGSLWAWGANWDGQLGDGTTETRRSPVRIGDGYVAVAGGSAHTLALKGDGSLWAWGYNGNGGLGTGDWSNHALPTQVGEGYAAIAAGQYHSLAIKHDGSVWAWGYGGEGRLGDGTTNTSLVPKQLFSPSAVTPALAGLTLADGTLSPAFAPARRSYTVTVAATVASTTVTPIAADPASAIMVNDSPAVSGTPSNPISLVSGPNVIRISVTPPGGSAVLYSITVTRAIAEVPGVPVIQAVTAGIGQATIEFAAPSNDGGSPITGYTVTASPGGATVSGVGSPLEIGGLSNGETYTFSVAATNAVGTGPAAQSPAVTLPTVPGKPVIGAVVAGNAEVAVSFAPPNSDGGSPIVSYTAIASPGGATASGSASPIPVSGLTNGVSYTFTVVATNAVGSGPASDPSLPAVPLAPTFPLVINNWGGGSVTITGGAICTGVCTTSFDPGSTVSVSAAADGEHVFLGWADDCGDQPTCTVTMNSARTLVPRFAPKVSFVSIAAGGYHTLALDADGALWAWGNNEVGQLGDGTTTDRQVPVRVGGSFVQIAAGWRHSLALKADGSLWSWGENSQGQLGDGTLENRRSPMLIGSGYIAIGAGSQHSIALKSDAALWAWGRNDEGQVGDGTTLASNVPKQVGSGFARIFSGAEHNFAIAIDGSLWAWGNNAFGQLGDGTNLRSSMPKQVGDGYVFVSPGKGGRWSHTLAIKPDGSLWAWGYNEEGNLGDGSVGSSAIAKRIGEGYVTAAAGASHSLATRNDGSIWAWGWNGYSQIGDGTQTDVTIPKQVSVGIASVAAYNHSLAIKNDGSLWAWGRNAWGRLGDGTTTDRPIPRQITVPAAAGAGQSSANLLWLGVSNGVLSPSFSPLVTAYTLTVPHDVRSLSLTPYLVDTTASMQVNGVAASSGVAAAPVSLNNGTNTISIVVSTGDGKTRTYSVVVTRLPGVPAAPTIGSASGGDRQATVMFEPPSDDGGSSITDYVVTATPGGQTAVGYSSPVTIAGLTNHTSYTFTVSARNAVGTGAASAASNAVVPVPPKFVLSLGALGGGRVTTNTGMDCPGTCSAEVYAGTYVTLTPAANAGNSFLGWGGVCRGTGSCALIVNGNTNVSARFVATGGTSLIATKRWHSAILKADRSLWTWGYNGSGQLGNGLLAHLTAPHKIGDGYAAVALGESHTLAVGTDGALWAWGANSYGQLGDGSKTDSAEPKRIGSGYISVAAGTMHSIALKSDGSLWAWGSNAQGRLGDGTLTERLVPTQIGTGYVAIAVGDDHNLALKSDGSLWTWGSNGNGQLGDGGATSYAINPKSIGTGYVAIAAASASSLALKTDGTLLGWGKNDQGQLGDGTRTQRKSPTTIGNGFVLAAIGGGHSVALKGDGSLWSWGANNQGQLGDGTTTGRLVPEKVGDGYVSIAAGESHSLGLLANGSVVSWGDNNYGQLGRGNKTDSSSPVALLFDSGTPVVALNSLAQVNASSVRLLYSASDAESGISSVLLQVSEVEDFTTLSVPQADLGTSGNAVANVPSTTNPLYLRVASVDGAGNRSAWSAPQSITLVPPPTAAFSMTPSTGEAPLAVQFSDESTGGATSWSWNFGDNGPGTSNQQSPKATFAAPGTYSVSLVATGPGGGSAAVAHTVTVVADATAPVITDVSLGAIPLADGATLTGDATVTVKAVDAGGIKSANATLNGTALTPVSRGGGVYDVAIGTASLANGAYTLALRVTDNAGNIADASRTLNIAVPPPPAPGLTSPANGAKTRTVSQAVAGSSAAGTEARLYVNSVLQGDWIPVVAGSFSATVSLTEGANVITAEVRNIHGTSARSAGVTVTLDTVAPSATLTGVAQTGKDKMSFTYGATDTGGTGSGTGIARYVLQVADNADFSHIVVAEADAAIGGSDTRGIAASPATLYARVAAFDGAGNRSAWSAVRSFVVNPPPTAAFDMSVASGEAPLTVSFTDTSIIASGLSVTGWSWTFANGTPATATQRNPTAVFSTAGTHTVGLIVTGDSGQSAVVNHTVTVTADATPPTYKSLKVGATDVVDGRVVAGLTKFVVVATDKSGIGGLSATVNGSALGVAQTGSTATDKTFEVTLDPATIPNGTTSLQLRVTDAAGNGSDLSRTVEINVPAATVGAITAPANGHKTSVASIAVSGTTAGTHARVYVNGTLQGDWVAVSGGSFATTVALGEGSNVISAEARDIHGISATRTVGPTVVLDTVAPVATLAGVTQTGKDKMTFAYSATDTGGTGTGTGIARYVLQVADVADFSHIVVAEADAAIGGSDTRGIAASPATLYARVAAIDGAGNRSAWSAARSFVVVPPPTAAFSMSPTGGEAPLAVQFTDTSTGGATAWAWNFGAGGPAAATAQHPKATFTAPGTYSVSLVASGTGGASVAATQTLVVTADVTAPAITSATLGGTALVDGMRLTGNATLAFTATDAGGLGTVTAALGGKALAVTSAGGGSYRAEIDAIGTDNGTYPLVIRVGDAAGNVAELSRSVTIDVGPPPAPTWLSPATGYRSNQSAVAVRGASALGSEVRLFQGDVAIGDWQPVAAGAFAANVVLNEGANSLTAEVRNRHGVSGRSVALVLNLDTSKPGAPTNLVATALSGGKVRLTWTRPADARAVSLNLYRAGSAFDNPAAATKVNSAPLATGAAYADDTPPGDGVYYYRLGSLNDLGTAGSLGNLAQVTVDATAPAVSALTFTPQGKYDAATQRYGQGRVGVALTVSEPLQGLPYLAIVPAGGIPLLIDLAKVDDHHYTGSFVIDGTVPSGPATVSYSARDATGNRSTAVPANSGIKIDTAGPDLVGIVIDPVAPVKADVTPVLTVAFTLSKPVKPGTAPQVLAQLSGAGRTPFAVGGLTQADSLVWRASVALPADAGRNGPETLSFAWVASDDLDNASTKVTAPNAFQVYQGDLPPLGVPGAFSAKAQPGGKVLLSWTAVADAAAYQLYRQAPGEAGLTAYQRVSGISYLDQTATDGRYRYAVASIRSSNGQESLSGQSNVLEVGASASAPGAPQGLALVLTSRGIQATWQAPVASSVASYNVYRAGGNRITSVQGLVPLRSLVISTAYIDGAPNPAQAAYTVTALDAAGNESVPAESAYLNVSLLPVPTLRVVQSGNDLPVLSWTAPNGNLAGYLVYLGSDSSRIKLTPATIGGLSYTDTGYSGGERRYTVASVDGTGNEIGRGIVLPSVATAVVSGLPLKRGIMNRLQVQVTNTGTSALAGARAIVALQGKDHKSEVFALAPQETRLATVIVGGYPDLADAAGAQIGIEAVPAEGEYVKRTAAQTLSVVDGALSVGIATEAFTRGANGQVRLVVENTSDVEIELLTARANGSAVSTEMRLKLLSSDGNLLATQAVQQAVGTNLVTLTNGDTVARIPAGGSYRSDPFALRIPGSSPDNVRVRLEIDSLRYHSGKDDQVLIAGRSAETTARLVDTAYVGAVTDVTPVTSYGERDIVISGQASERSGGNPVPNARLKLVFNRQGFERSVELITDAGGRFAHTFKPTASDGGIYQVAAIHPELTERPVQKAFTIERVAVSPTTFNLTQARNLGYTIPFTLKAGAATVANNIRVLFEAQRQPTGALPTGIRIDLPAAVNIAENQSLPLNVGFVADNSAQPSGRLVLSVYSDDQPGAPIALLTVNYSLIANQPNVVSTPSYLETGLAQGGSDVVSVQVRNNGTLDAVDLRFRLAREDGSPAPAWITLASAADGTLAIGASRSVDVAVTPPANLDDGVYRFLLKMSGANIADGQMNVIVSVTQSGQGNVLFKASDIYTATVDKTGKLIQGLANASVKIQNEDVATVAATVTTDGVGEAYFPNLPAGNYRYRITANNHQELAGRFQVKPGVSLTLPVFLDYTLVTVTWSVKEVTIEDRYDITLNATFETNVPAPVVVMEPASVSLPRLLPGQTYSGEISLTNYGLTRADKLNLRLPTTDAYLKYEFLANLPTALEAKQRVTIPYRVTALRLFGSSATAPVATGGTGGTSGTGTTSASASQVVGPDGNLYDASVSPNPGCYSYSVPATASCSYVCANGVESNNCGSSAYWTSASNSTCPAAATGGGGGGTGGGGSGGGGGGGGGSFGGGGGGSIGGFTDLKGIPPCIKCLGEMIKPKCATCGGS